MASSPLTLDHPRAKPAGLGKSEARSSSIHRWKALGKEASLVFAGQAAAGIGSLIAVRVLTGLLSPAVFGEFALSLTIVTIIQYCYAGTSAAAMRFYVPALEKGQSGEFMCAAWKMQHLRDLLVVLLTLGGILLLMATGHNSLIPLGLAIVVMAVVTSYGVFMDGLQNAARQRAVVALHQGVGSWLRLGCAALCVTLTSASAASVLWGFAAGGAMVMASQYIFYRRIKQKASLTITTGPLAVEPSREWHNSMTGFAWPYIIWCVPVWIQFSSDRWALEWFASPVEVGIYAALCQLAFLPVKSLTQLITQLVMPIVFARAGDLTNAGRVANSCALNRRLVQIALIWTIAAVLGTMLFQAPLGQIFLDPRYRSSLYLLPALILSAGLFATAQLAEIQTITLNQTAHLIRPKISIAVFACIAFLVGASRFGIVGVVWGSVLANAAILIWIWKVNTTLASREPVSRLSVAVAPDFAS